MSGIKQKFAIGSLWFALGRGSSHIASFVIFAILARLLGPLDFGIVAFAMVFIDLSRAVALSGLPIALVRERDWDDEVASTAFWGNMAFAAALAVIVGGGFGFAMGIYYSEDLQWVILALSATLVVDAARATHEAKLQRVFRFDSLAKRTVVATTGAGILGVALAFMGFGVWALVINRIANSLIQTIIVWRAEPWTPRFVFLREKFAGLFRFGIHLGGAAVFGAFNKRVPELIAGLMIGPVAVGFYRVGSRIVGMLSDLTIAPMQATVVAAFSRVEGNDGLVRAYLKVTNAVGIVAFPAFYGLAVLADDLVLVLFGEKWAQSGVVMSMLALIGGAATISYFVHPLLAVAGKSHLTSLRSLLLLLSSLAVGLATAPFGITALALGFSVRGYLGVIPTLLLLKRAVGVPPMAVIRGVLPSFLSAVVMAIALYAVHMQMDGLEPVLRILVLAPLGAALYATVLLVFFRGYLHGLWLDVGPIVAPLVQRYRASRA